MTSTRTGARHRHSWCHAELRELTLRDWCGWGRVFEPPESRANSVGGSKQPTTGRHSRPAGFTLLEVLLTSLLAGVVLVSLWSLSDIYLRLFVSGKKKIDEVQLVRGLTHQISQDVSQVVQIGPPERMDTLALSPGTGLLPRTSSPPNGLGMPGRNQAGNFNSPAANPNASPGLAGINRTPGPPAIQPSFPQVAERKSDLATPKFGLFGSKHALRLIVLIADPLAFREPTDLSDILPEPGQPRAPLASELRTIEYSFDSHHETGSTGQQRPTGLIRREWPWETWSGIRLASQQMGGSATGASLMPPEVAEWTAEDALAFENNQNILHLPQVTAFEFHYFDGIDWETEWNSAERQQLPRLVEVLFTVKSPGADERAGQSSEDEEDVDEPISLSDQNSSGQSSVQSTRHGMIYRQLIHLPSWEVGPREMPGPFRPLAESANPARLMGARQP